MQALRETIPQDGFGVSESLCSSLGVISVSLPNVATLNSHSFSDFHYYLFNCQLRMSAEPLMLVLPYPNSDLNNSLHSKGPERGPELHLQRQTPGLGDEWQREDGTEVRFPFCCSSVCCFVSTGSYQGKGHERK